MLGSALELLCQRDCLLSDGTMICDHSVRKPLHLCILTLLERLLCICDVEVIGRNADVGDLRIRKLCSGYTRTGSAQRYNHTCSNDDWFVHDLLLGGSKGPEARGDRRSQVTGSQCLPSPSVPPFERPVPGNGCFRPASAAFIVGRRTS